jgi:hypothetical protein
MVIWILSCHLTSLLSSEVLDALVRLQVDLHEHETPVGFGEFVSMATKGVGVTDGCWGTTVGEEMHQLVDGFLVIVVEVPEHCAIWAMSLWMSLVTSIQRWEFYGIADEEDGSIVENEVVIAFLGEELDAPSSWIPNGVRRATLWSYGRYSSESWSLLAHFGEESRRCEIADVCNIVLV